MNDTKLAAAELRKAADRLDPPQPPPVLPSGDITPAEGLRRIRAIEEDATLDLCYGDAAIWKVYSGYKAGGRFSTIREAVEEFELKNRPQSLEAKASIENADAAIEQAAMHF